MPFHIPNSKKGKRVNQTPIKVKPDKESRKSKNIMGLVNSRNNPTSNQSRIFLPISAILLPALFLVTTLAMDK